MARKKSRIRIPLFKAKINKQTILNIIGFLCVATAFVFAISYLKNFSPGGDGRILSQINDWFVSRFGGLSIFIPVILLMIAGHFFNTKKLKFIKPNVTLGICLIFISLLGVFQSGSYGAAIYQNLSLDFSVAGAIVILLIVFIIGLILFLDTSIDVFFLFILSIVTMIFTFMKRLLVGDGTKKEEKEKGKEDEFIHDKKKEEPLPKLPLIPTISKPAPQPTLTQAALGKELSIKPLSTPKTAWVYPPLSLLMDIQQQEADRGDVKHNADVIEKTLDSFGIRARVSEINFGPAVTQYAIEITMGTKLSKITALSNDLALALAASTGQVRIEAPIPGRSLVGIEIPNKRPEIVSLKRMLSSPAFANTTDPLLVPMGLDVSGQPQATSITKMPHVLIAGTTGSGKSVILNAWISTFLFRTKPEELRLIMVDPKRVELSLYNGIPHLLSEVIVDPEKIIAALRWTVGEMEARYKEFAHVGARNLESFNAMEGIQKKPYIVFIIDELADLMIFASAEAEELITRIAQMARATGIHLVLATQRPSVDVITGLMKANIPARVAFNVSSMIDSRVIIDMPGAEKLLGKGDMLFLPPDQAKPRRIQGSFVAEKEVNQVVRFLRSQVPEVHYTEEVTAQDSGVGGRGGTMAIGGGEKDPLFDQALELILRDNKASASYLQRRLSVGYARAAKILDQLEAAGYIGPAQGAKPREVLKRSVGTEDAVGQEEI